MGKRDELYDSIRLPLLRTIIIDWSKSHPMVTKVTLWRSKEPELSYVLVAEVPPFPDAKFEKRRKYKACLQALRNLSQAKSKEPSCESSKAPPSIQYPSDQIFSDREEEIINLYESTETDCSHLWRWLPEIYKEKLPRLYRHEWMWINVEPGEELDDTLVLTDSGHVLYERDPVPEVMGIEGEPTQDDPGRRSRSSDDRKRAQEMAGTFIKECQLTGEAYTRIDAVSYIKQKLGMKYADKTIGRWINDLFTPEEKKGGRPKQKPLVNS